MKGTLRQRYSLLSSTLYIVLGAVITIRSIVSHVLPLILLGVVLIALGAVKIRDYLRWTGSFRGS